MEHGQKLLVIGMGSPSDKKLLEGLIVDYLPLEQFLGFEHIKLYHHPKTNNPLITSIHRVTMDTIEYAHDLRRMNETEKVCSLLFGGLALAMPGVVAAEAVTVPINSVYTDIDAFFNVYKIPDGTPVGVASDLAKGVDLSAKVLAATIDDKITLVVSGNCKSADDVKKQLGYFGFETEVVSDNGGEYSNSFTLGLADSPSTLVDLDKRIKFGAIAAEKTNASLDVYAVMDKIEHCLVIGRPVNLAFYAARVAGLSNPDCKEKLVKFRSDEAAKYGQRERMELANFK